MGNVSIKQNDTEIMLNLLFISIDPLDENTSDGGQVRSKLLLDAIRTVNPYGNNYILTRSGSNLFCDPNLFVRHFDIKPISYDRISGIFTKFIKSLAGMGYLPRRIVKEYNPEFYFPNVRFDFIILRFQRSACLFPYHKIAPIIIDYDNHPLQSFDSVYKYYLPSVIRPIAKIFSRFQFYSVRKHIFGGFVSSLEYSNRIWHNIRYLPNIVPLPSKAYNANHETRDYLFTIGDMSFPANYMGVDRFLRDIWPGFHNKHPNIMYVIGGKNLPDSYISKWGKIEGVEYRGYIADLNIAYERCLAAVIPIYQGSGTAIKTREALAYSRCCISSVFGARGLENSNDILNNGLFIFETEIDFVNIYETIINKKKRLAFENNVYNYACHNFSSSVYTETLRNMLVNQNL